jgi:hypothetical protein
MSEVIKKYSVRNFREEVFLGKNSIDVEKINFGINFFARGISLIENLFAIF